MAPKDSIRMSHRPEVVAVVLTYNRLKLLREALSRIERQTYAPARIIVIENGATDGTRDYLRELADDERFDIVSLEKNIGAAGGFALGIRRAAALMHDLVWVMDDDVMPEPDALERLVEAHSLLVAEGCPPNLLVSAAVNDAGEPMNVPTIAAEIGPAGYSSWTKRLRYGLMPISQATFVSALIPRVAIERVGLPLAEMFIWGDDIEYTWRLTSAGGGYIVGRSQVAHLGRHSAISIHEDMAPSREKLFFYYYRNNMFIARKRGGKAFARFLWRHLAPDLLRLTLHLEIKKLSIVLSGVAASLAFDPKPDFVRAPVASFRSQTAPDDPPVAPPALATRGPARDT